MSPRPRTTKPKPPPKPAPPAATRRRTTVAEKQSKLIDQLAKLVQVQRTARSAVTLERSARGQTVITVHVQVGDEPGLDSIAHAEKRAREIYDKLARTYPVVEYQ